MDWWGLLHSAVVAAVEPCVAQMAVVDVVVEDDTDDSFSAWKERRIVVGVVEMPGA